MLWSYIKIFFISMLPIIELRGAIPVSQAMGLPLLSSYIVCVLGNMLPVPFIYLFARRVLVWGSQLSNKRLSSFFTWFLQKGEKAGEKLLSKGSNSIYIALMLFVGIPLPGTGAWTGILAASILDLEAKKACLAVLAGVLLAGVIMAIPSFGLFSLLRS